MKYRVGIIDDDKTKITQLITYIQAGWNDENGSLMKKDYKDIELIPEEINLESDISAMVEKVVELKFDALIIDYKLSSQQNISYTGIELAKAIDDRLRDFPIFILTSYEDDVYTKETIDAYQVFDFERYIAEDKERLEINSKIVQQIRKYNATIKRWHEELMSLIPHAKESAIIDERILQLDSLIENSIDGNSALTKKLKQDLNNTDHIQTLIEKIDEIIKKE